MTESVWGAVGLGYGIGLLAATGAAFAYVAWIAWTYWRGK